MLAHCVQDKYHSRTRLEERFGRLDGPDEGMTWRKLGNIFGPRHHRGVVRSHAQVPTVLLLPDRLRVFYADRTGDGKSFPTFVDVDRGDPTRVVYCHERPVLELGAPGSFDDDGIMPSCVVVHDGRVRLYYTGWNRRVTVPYHTATGLAVSDDGGLTFTRLFEGPILDRLREEPYLITTLWIMREGSLWRAWYGAGVRWTKVASTFEPVYVLKSARSSDGVRWERSDIACIEPRHEREAACRPSVIKTGDTYRMWYCYRDSEGYRDGAGAYRIGYAESNDGVRFRRDDARAGIDVSEDGWDSSMLCYPAIVEVDTKTYLFYNGNHFGQTGIGLAVLED
jgi:hypothetical protein